MWHGRVFGVGAFLSSAWLVAAPAMPGGCGPVGGGTGGTGPTPVCGNGVVEGDELCDGNRYMAGVDGSCSSWSDSYLSGSLRCNPQSCTIDESDCTTQICGNGKLDLYEECEGEAFREWWYKPSYGAENTCQYFDEKYGSGLLRCRPDCTSDTSACRVTVCGDGKAESTEQCDGADLGRIQNCVEASGIVSQDALYEYGGGVLACRADCTWDASGCRRVVCGDGRIEGSEQCEAGDLRGNTCADLPFPLVPVIGPPQNWRGGTLRCTTCGYDTSGCVPPPGCYLGGSPTRPTVLCY